MAQEAKRCNLDNGTIPALPSLSEADTADVDSFLDEMLLILPVLGVSAFEKPAPPPVNEKQMLYLNVKGISAKGYEAAQGFVVLAGSQAETSEADYTPSSVVALRQTLREKGLLALEGEHLVLQQDYTFTSPSTASSVLVGRTSNGRLEWKDKNGVSLKDLQAEATRREDQ